MTICTHCGAEIERDPMREDWVDVGTASLMYCYDQDDLMTDSTRHEPAPVDETCDEHGDFLARGRCDTCGAPVNDNGCSTDPTHEVALTGFELPAAVRGPLWVHRYDEARAAEMIGNLR